MKWDVNPEPWVVNRRGYVTRFTNRISNGFAPLVLKL